MRLAFWIAAPFVLGCAGEPFRFVGERGPADGGAEATVPPERDRVGHAVPVGEQRAARAERFAEGGWVGFAASSGNGVAAFQLRDGVALARHDVGGAVLDLAWHAGWQRLLVVEGDDDLDASRLHSLALVDGELVATETSDPVSGVARVWPSGSRALVVSDEIGASWAPFDERLEPVAAAGLVALPASLVPSRERALLFHALNVDAFVAGRPGVEVVEARHDGAAWGVERWPLGVEPGGGARLVADRSGVRAWLVRSASEPGVVDIGTLDLSALAAPPRLARRVVPGHHGSSPVDSALLPAETIATAHENGSLSIVPLSETDPAHAVALGAPVENAWSVRAVAAVGQRVLVATRDGIEAFVVTKESVEPDRAFEGRGLRAPLVVATDNR